MHKTDRFIRQQLKELDRELLHLVVTQAHEDVDDLATELSTTVTAVMAVLIEATQQTRRRQRLQATDRAYVVAARMIVCAYTKGLQRGRQLHDED